MALVGIAVASLVMVGFASAVYRNAGAGKYQTGVFAKVYGRGDWIYLGTIGARETLLSLGLPSVPISAYYHVVCDGHAFIAGDGSELEIAIGVDSTITDPSTYRYYQCYESMRVFTGVHTERVYYLDPGAHTFHFLGVLMDGSSVSINYHTITATVFSDGSLIDLAETTEAGVTPDGRP